MVCMNGIIVIHKILINGAGEIMRLIESKLYDAKSIFESFYLTKTLIPWVAEDFFLPEFLGIDVNRDSISGIKFYYIPQPNKKNQMFMYNDSFREYLSSSLSNCNTSTILNDSFHLFDFSIPYYGHNNPSLRIILKSLDDKTKGTAFLEDGQGIGRNDVVSETDKICSIILENTKSNRNPMHLFGFDINLKDNLIRQLKTYFTLIHFESNTSFKGVRVNEQALNSCLEIIKMMGLDSFKSNFLNIYEKSIHEGAFLDFIGLNYTPTSKSLKTYFCVDKKSLNNKRRFRIENLFSDSTKREIIKKIASVMDNLHYIPEIIGFDIRSRVDIATKLYFKPPCAM